MGDYKPALEKPTGLLIEPLDVLMFRDARPFNATDTARSILPTPQTLAGMLRTHALQTFGIPPSKLHGLRGDTSASPRKLIAAHLAVQGPWLCQLADDLGQMQDQVKDLYVPLPATLVQFGKDRDAPLGRFLPSDTPLEGWNNPENPCRDLLPLLPSAYDKAEAAADENKAPREVTERRWMGKHALKAFLDGEPLRHADLKSDACLFLSEERTSLTVQPDTLTSDPGRIFSASFLRLEKNIAFYAECGVESHAPQDVLAQAEAGLEELIPEDGIILPFGGEGRRVRVRRLPQPWQWPSAPETRGSDSYFTLLISPVIFHQKNGNTNRAIWQPPCVTRLRAAAVPRPLPVSGFGLNADDLSRAGGIPRPMRYAVPAGAVYFWKNGKNADPTKEPLPSLLQLAESPQDRAAGWGLALKGVWK